MSRSNKHVYMGVGFVLASVVVAVVLYIGIKLGSASEPTPTEPAPTNITTNDAASQNPEAPSAENEEAPTEAETSADQTLTNADLIGVHGQNVSSGEGFCDGATWSFLPDGRLMSWNEDHSMYMHGFWKIDGNRLLITNAAVGKEDGSQVIDVADSEMPISKQDDILTIGEMRYQPCTQPS